MRIIIAGTRTFNDKGLLFRVMDKLTAPLMEVTVLSGAAKGADALGEEWAHSWYWVVLRYHADWDKHGKAAGPIRNEQMAENADALVAFHDGSSPGTADMIERARKHKLRTKVIRYGDQTQARPA